jgi:preprotein translocase subunit Sss1
LLDSPIDYDVSVTRTMKKPSRFLFAAMSVAFGICILGLIGGMLYDLCMVLLRHRTLENVLGNSIPLFKTLGGLGIAGMLLFFAFLISLISKKDQGKPR